jgi:anaerobic dimethyl sulfoxide reductase subunit B (iron-sulfur subunit)
MPQLAFHIDVGACSGCKSCQVACKDRNDLDVGRRWRRVADVEGGDWTRQGAAWLTTVFSYSLSVACMHCQRPRCVEACPTGAMKKRADGVVALARERCIGCHYCEWACPYGAPQYDPRDGRMSKCDFCVEELDRGRPPVCVAACPMRALDFGELEELRARHGALNHVYPMPDPTLTDPAIVITPHRDSARDAAVAAHVANREELR